MDPLAKLNDIQLAPAVANYPIAIGWWLLLALVVAVIFIVWQFIKRHQQRTQVKKQALLQLTQATSTDAMIAIIKWSAMQYGYRSEIANLYGKHLITWMQQQLPSKQQPAFAKLADFDFSVFYQSNMPENTLAQLQALAEFWLNHALPLSASQTQTQLQEAK